MNKSNYLFSGSNNLGALGLYLFLFTSFSPHETFPLMPACTRAGTDSTSVCKTLLAHVIPAPFNTQNHRASCFLLSVFKCPHTCWMRVRSGFRTGSVSEVSLGSYGAAPLSGLEPPELCICEEVCRLTLSSMYWSSDAWSCLLLWDKMVRRPLTMTDFPFMMSWIIRHQVKPVWCYLHHRKPLNLPK